MTEPYRPRHAVRIVTATSLFDGHDASINIMRRLMQAGGVEVIHLGHNRSVEEIIDAATQEDVQAIAVTSYQGGHIEFFKYIIDMLRERDLSHIRVFGGGGGVIVPREIRELESYGVGKIFSPEDGRRMGLQGMIDFLVSQADFAPPAAEPQGMEGLSPERRAWPQVARWISLAENNVLAPDSAVAALFDRLRLHRAKTPVIGVTGTGGAGKSSLIDEMVRCFLAAYPDKRLALLSVDPSKWKTGGALLGDRIRMNAIHHPRVFMRSLATRHSRSELSRAIDDAIAVVKAAGYDLVIVETSGIGQGDHQIIDVSDVSVYVMTSEFGAATQLEKIDMIDFADAVVINKYDRRGAEDALRAVRKQWRRSRNDFDRPDDQTPVFGTVASQFDDPGVERFFHRLMAMVSEKTGGLWPLPAEPAAAPVGVSLSPDGLSSLAPLHSAEFPEARPSGGVIPAERVNYLAEIVHAARDYRAFVEAQVEVARRLYQLQGARRLLAEGEEGAANRNGSAALAELDEQIRSWQERLHPDCRRILDNWDGLCTSYRQAQWVTTARDREIVTALFTTTLSGTPIPKVALPRYADWGEILRWALNENVPGQFPFTAGVFPFKREGEDPRRQFAGEGTPERTNRRFHYLCKDDPAIRLSTAFDSVTLYGEDPADRPDIYGKIGNSGVNVCTWEDVKRLYAGFDLCAPNTSVSMTINGPAPILLAMFLQTAIDQQVDRFTEREGRRPNPDEWARLRAETLQRVRGTVQADILKEDQGQNTCIFSTDFALKMMGDIQEYFIQERVRNYYSVSISGYHIAEAGANPITQLAFTLANGFTYVEYYLSRGMKIDDFAPNLSFFFSNGLDPEYSVLGRVARRIWAVVMKQKYHANERSQKLKYHIQTSGRSLHAQEMDFNDIRTTLQALSAIYDNCNSLHTNAYDEAVTTPTEASVRRAMAIQLIIGKEFGLAKNENPLQGAFIIEELTDLVEEAVLAEFLRLNERGGVLGAMETQYQRNKIQEESLLYETRKHTGELPIIGVNTFLNPEGSDVEENIELSRATEEEKRQQIDRLREFQHRHREEAALALARLKDVVRNGGNIFAEMMETVPVASLGQITAALYEVGGRYRRNM
ncbi:methylmalonyl-CoA mutase [Heliobacterium gestii]|uniref:Fused isobutyryl-CoA mutase n=1 Tax=Heliomicrobium gestii TaxID=2699 RepID=A0A845LFE5_HELGE|nr:fused isobutyryl-CoA mutase/GTPase IcmF [Heliomicrobium gestii]MBM7867731.1 methylmalonyl-CoA mutase [Heliomicrobium gestii]MZP44124.1 methylmalonyl-CoA mutase [Heliomicrobium gestii]